MEVVECRRVTAKSQCVLLRGFWWEMKRRGVVMWKGGLDMVVMECGLWIVGCGMWIVE
jgi:hypothetical protein